jgi:phosphoglycerate dehydrogenase-like enzyme
MNAIVIDKDYGSVTAEELDCVATAYAAAGIQLKRLDYQVVAAQQKEPTEDEIIAGCKDAMAILATGNPPISRKVLEALPQVKFVQRFGAGVNSIDLDAAADMGVMVLNLPGFCAKELADVATAMIMSLIRNTAYYDREVRKGNWPKCKYLLPPDVRKLTLGLYGFGLAGRYLHDIFYKGFGTKVIACDPYVSDTIKGQYPDVHFVSFDELVTNSDIISIHVILTPETTHVFNREVFKEMKDSAMIINTSRGPVIDNDDLAWALETGEIRYAGLDTVEREPLPEKDPFKTLDNIIVNPHCGSYGVGSKKTQIQMTCDIVPQAVTTGKVPGRCVANKAVLSKNVGYQFI